MIYLLLLLILGGLRFHLLGLKPAHHDEAINGFFVNQIWETGWFQYDPANYHGPLLFYLFAFAERSFGWGVEAFRFVTVFFSIAQLLLVWWYLRKRVSLSGWHLLPLLVSPGFVFFARSAIHETVFVFFMTMFLLGALEIFFANQEGDEFELVDLNAERRRRRGWAMMIWGLWGCMALKETWVLFVLAGVISYFVVWRLQGLSVRRGELREDLRACLPHFGAAFLLLFFLFTGFLQRPQGVFDFFLAYLPWTKTGLDLSGHGKPVTFWLQLTAKHEVPIFIYMVATFILGVTYFRRLRAGTQWLFLTAFLHFAFFSIIPYKTPWCVISVLTPCVLAGMMVWNDLRVKGFLFRRSLALVILVLCALQYKVMWQLNFVDPVPMGHEYVYVQTDKRVGHLIQGLYQHLRKNPSLRSLKIQVGGDESWPMAWTLAQFPNLKFQAVQQGLVDQVDLLIVNADEAATVEPLLPIADFWMAEFPIRDGRGLSRFYWRKSRFGAEDFAGGSL